MTKRDLNKTRHTGSVWLGGTGGGYIPGTGTTKKVDFVRTGVYEYSERERGKFRYEFIVKE